MAEFSAHRASAVSDTDVPWTSIAVMIRCVCVQIFRCLNSIRGLKRLSRYFPMRSGYVLSVEMYTGWTRSMGPTVR